MIITFFWITANYCLAFVPNAEQQLNSTVCRFLVTATNFQMLPKIIFPLFLQLKSNFVLHLVKTDMQLMLHYLRSKTVDNNNLPNLHWLLQNIFWPIQMLRMNLNFHIVSNRLYQIWPFSLNATKFSWFSFWKLSLWIERLLKIKRLLKRCLSYCTHERWNQQLPSHEIQQFFSSPLKIAICYCFCKTGKLSTK